jgi:hypothetical protein
VEAQRYVQSVVGDGSQFKNHGQLMKRVTQLLNERENLPKDCRACIVRQFARHIPAGEQLPCRLRTKGIGGLGGPGIPPWTGPDQPLSAVKLLLKVSPTAEKAMFLSKDPAIYPPIANAPSDPTLFGATVEFCSAQGTAVFDLPANAWHLNGSGSVFKFTQPGTSADVKVAIIKGGRTLKIVSKAVGLPLPGGLDAVGVRVTTGDVRNCALFTLETIVKDEPGHYVAQDAHLDAVADCSNESLGCFVVP